MREDNVRKIWSEAELDAALADLNNDVEADDGLAFARASLLAAAGVEEAPPAGPRRSGAWRWLAVAAAVVTLVGSLGVAATLWTPDPPAISRPAAPVDLDRPLVPGEFRYAQKLGWELQIRYQQAVWVQQKVELWIPADPAGVWHRRTTWTGVVQGLGPADAQHVQVDLPPKDEFGPGGGFPGDYQAPGASTPPGRTPPQKWLQPDAAFVASLVPDRASLATRLKYDPLNNFYDGREHSATEALTMVRSVLELGLAPENVRFALSGAFGGVTGGFVVPGHTPDGRPAVVLGAKDSDQRLYLDPATAHLLAWDGGQPAPAITSTPNSTPSWTTTERQKPQRRPGDPTSVYSFAITRTSG
ncbi:hypothetical protein [Amycolatopsis sp. lyj-23]|uniref:hypothetical protein n=1 Tax=Amycolatopsis sp. lyj-23 TaxID=2789283 RepID=UPI00397C6616